VTTVTPDDNAPKYVEYEVRDRAGVLQATHCRKDRPDGKKDMWWKDGLNGRHPGSLPLYGIDVLPPDTAVVLVEGEKTRDALARVNIWSVAHVAGADILPSVETLSDLAGRDVVLWPDNDEPGRRLMDYAAKQLGSVAKSVRLVEWPASPPKGDAADAIEQGVDVSALIYTAKAVESPRSKLRIYTASEFSDIAPEQPHWLCQGLWACNALSFLNAKIKAGKTTLVMHMIASVLDGRDFAGLPTSKASVLYLTEQPKASFRRLLDDSGLSRRSDLHILSRQDMFGMDWPEVVAYSVEYCLEHGIEGIVADTLSKLSGIKDENDSSAARAAMDPMQKAAHKGLASLVVQHSRKSDGETVDTARGSSAFGGDADIILSLTRPKGSANSPEERQINSASRFDETPDEWIIELTDSGYRNVGPAWVSKRNSHAEAIREALQKLSVQIPLTPLGYGRIDSNPSVHTQNTGGAIGRIGSKELAEVTGLTQSQIQKAIAGMDDVVAEGKGPARKYSLNQPTESDIESLARLF